MTRLVWGDPDKRFHEIGIDRGVFYPLDGVAVPWNGLTAVSEAPSGSDLYEGHFDGQKFRQQRQSGSFSATLRAYTYPPEFEIYEGIDPTNTGSRIRKMFNLSYRTAIGNDSTPNSAFLIHLVYNAIVAPTNKVFNTFGGSSEANSFEWELQTVPEILSSGEISAHVVVDTRIAYPWAVDTLERIIYGSEFSDPRFPEIQEVIDIFENASILRITDNGDGTWTADGPDEAIRMLDHRTFEIEWPSAVYIDTKTYRISSL